MSHFFSTQGLGSAIPLTPVAKAELAGWRNSLPQRLRHWVDDSGFEARPGQCLGLPGENGRVESFAFGMQTEGWLFQLASVYRHLPSGNYVVQASWEETNLEQAAVGWALAAYRFDRYKKDHRKERTLALPPAIAARAESLCRAQYLVRNLVNTPTEHLGPQQLAEAVAEVAHEHGAAFRAVVGDELLAGNFPAIHAVGRASDSAPRLAELKWGDETAPLLALVGKGVCFDTGGLDLKNASGMALMKKDMGGAAHALALAQLIMEHRLPVRLLLLIPAVENSVSGNAYRPGDIIATRKGLSIEIGNTDAEGRVILSDALALACEHQPDLLIDFATLTGAARVALGPDLPALFCNVPEIALDLQNAGLAVEDPLWPMPLYRPYAEQIKSPIADLNNSSKSSYAGCITAALFLEHFVTEGTPWVHIDTFAWNPSNRPGRPEGGEALGLRAVFRYLQNRYG